MAAVLTPRPAPSTRPRAPRLVVLEGGRSDRRRAMRRVYRRRRLAVLTVVVLAATFVGRLLPDAGAAPAPRAAVPAEVVAGPGDTIWDLAVGLDRPGDVRDTVDLLAEHNGTDRLVPGQVVEIPAELRR